MNEKVMDKIQKLLNLATSDNEAEAMLAMMRAVELLDKHDVSLEDFKNSNGNAKDFIGNENSIFSYGGDWENALLYEIGVVFNCIVIKVRKHTGNSFSVIGAKTDIILWTHFCNYLRRKIYKSAEAAFHEFKADLKLEKIQKRKVMGDYEYKFWNKMKSKDSRNFSNSYLISCQAQICKRLRNMYEARKKVAQDHGTWGLVLKKDAAVSKRYKELFPNARTTSANTSCGSRSGMDQGTNAGNGINLSRPINAGTGPRALT